MAEYINREEACKHCNNKKEHCGKEKCPVYKAPAIDVVRCKECTHTRKAIDEKGRGIFCSIWGRGWHRVEPDDFCSYGERKTD